jgi:hypothetical protein
MRGSKKAAGIPMACSIPQMRGLGDPWMVYEAVLCKAGNVPAKALHPLRAHAADVAAGDVPAATGD